MTAMMLLSSHTKCHCLRSQTARMKPPLAYMCIQNTEQKVKHTTVQRDLSHQYALYVLCRQYGLLCVAAMLRPGLYLLAARPSKSKHQMLLLSRAHSSCYQSCRHQHGSRWQESDVLCVLLSSSPRWNVCSFRVHYLNQTPHSL